MPLSKGEDTAGAVSLHDENKYTKHLQNWLVLSEFFKSKPPVQDLRILMMLEIQGQCRPHMLDKLKARYNKTIARDEQAELEAYINARK
ncbi:MAG: hypothetical protein CL867_09740 [Cytophagaceae bacterium]|nr:hypothetical protein [Cytophagaceae bacterium]